VPKALLRPAGCAAEPGGHDRTSELCGARDAANVTQLRRELVVSCSIGSRLPERAADQKDLGPGSVTAAWLEDHASLALRKANRPGDEAQDPESLEFVGRTDC
jgi:hypothetical protein